MWSTLSKAPFLGTLSDVMIGNSQFGPLLKTLKAAGVDTQRLTRQIIAKGSELTQDPFSAAVELLLHEQDQVILVFQNLSQDPGKIQALAAAISALFSDRNGSLVAYITQVLQALAANPAMVQNLLKSKAQLRALLAQFMGSSNATDYSNHFSPGLPINLNAIQSAVPNLKPVASTLASTNGYSQLPVLPLAGQAQKPPVLNTLASSNSHGYLLMPAPQQQICPPHNNCCQCSCHCCQSFCR